jgi:hypothetical protein
MIKPLNKKHASTILGLTLDGSRLEAVVLSRTNGSVKIHGHVSIALALSPLSSEPELVGREIRIQLDQAGIREKRCIVCIPPNWLLTVDAKIPDLPEEDVASFLQIEAERGFPSGPENLQIASTRSKSKEGEQFALLMGVPNNHVAILEKVLKAAQLKPLGFSLGTAAMAGGMESAGLLLALGPRGLDLQMRAGGGIVALRSLDGAIEGEGAQKTVDAEAVAREVRITLGQLPQSLAQEITTATIVARGDMARQFMEEIGRALQSIGLRTSVPACSTTTPFSTTPHSDIALSPALALAANYLADNSPMPEFMPPRVSAWQQFFASSKLSSKKLVYAGAAAGGVALILIAVFGYQQVQIMMLDSHWKKIEKRVDAIKADEELIRKYRPWFDSSFTGLRIIKQLTESFPEDGYVSAKNLEVRDLSAVTCSGVARDNQSYQGVLDKLRTNGEITELKTDMLRGSSPVQFTFNFQWGDSNGGN